MEPEASQTTDTTSVPARWQPLSSIQRRVLGVLVEKAKTTPDAYPLSLNAVTTACNQKSNRDPVLELEDFEIDAFRKQCLLQGLDEISLTLQHADAIADFEERRREQEPWLF